MQRNAWATESALIHLFSDHAHQHGFLSLERVRGSVYVNAVYSLVCPHQSMHMHTYSKKATASFVCFLWLQGPTYRCGFAMIERPLRINTGTTTQAHMSPANTQMREDRASEYTARTVWGALSREWVPYCKEGRGVRDRGPQSRVRAWWTPYRREESRRSRVWRQCSL